MHMNKSVKDVKSFNQNAQDKRTKKENLMTEQFVGCFGEVADIKAVKSLGVCRIVVEVPIEQHKAVTNAFWGRDVLITPSDAKHGYGIATTDRLSETPKPTPNDYGAHYQELYKSGFFNNPALWRWAGTDGDYQEWVRNQPSCVSGKQDWYHGRDGSISKCEYAHVRRVANGAGTGIKPEYSGVPLTHDEHALQHAQGETALLQAFNINFTTAPEWFEKQAIKYRTNWIKSEIYAYFDVGSLVYSSP